MNDLRTALANDTGELPDRWNPDDEPGTTLVGTLLGIETIATSLGEARIAHIEDADDGHVWGVMIERSVLKNRFEQLQPQTGDTLGIKYIGQVEPRTKGGNAYHNYVVRVIRGATPPAAAVAQPVNRPDRGQDDDLPF